jgi:hypothetical protein
MAHMETSIEDYYMGIAQRYGKVEKEIWYDYPVYCGPNVLAFTMLGLGTMSGYPDIPTSNYCGPGPKAACPRLVVSNSRRPRIEPVVEKYV